MADSDVLGILSLLLAAGGAAYIVYTRLRRKAEEAEALAQMAAAAASSSTTAKTDPPSSPRVSEKKIAVDVQDTIPPTTRGLSTPTEPIRPPGSFRNDPRKLTLVAGSSQIITPEEAKKEQAEKTEKKTEKEEKEGAEKKAEGAEKKAEGAEKNEDEKKKVEAEKKEAEKKANDDDIIIAAKKTDPSEPPLQLPKVTAAVAAVAAVTPAAKPKPPLPKPQKIPSSPRSAPAAFTTDEAKTKPSVLTPEMRESDAREARAREEAASPVSVPPVSSGMIGKIPPQMRVGKTTIVSGAPPPANFDKAPATTTGTRKKPAEFIDVPRIEVEEDEDVEPTRVGRFQRRAIQPLVEKIVFDEGADKEPAASSEATPATPMSLVVYAMAQTDPGKRRKQNEDSLLVLEDLGLYIVADGMGGHRGGQYASKLAVKTMHEAFDQKNFEAAPHPDIPLEASELARAIQMSNSSILEEAAMKPELKGMGTTICAARFRSDKRRLYLGHVGDSRCYRVRNGVMKQMTADHTMADYGVAGPEGAHLSRALGVWPTVPIDVVMATPTLGDVYLLCSDGLTKMLPDGTIATQLLHEEDPRAAVERLVFFANAHGGKDNITVILLRVVEPGWAPPPTSRQSRPDS